MDTRDSSPALVAAALAACEIMGVMTCNYGVCTTPQLHWLVSHSYVFPSDVVMYEKHSKKVF
jgi:phosphomannomutase